MCGGGGGGGRAGEGIGGALTSFIRAKNPPLILMQHMIRVHTICKKANMTTYFVILLTNCSCTNSGGNMLDNIDLNL